VPEPEQNLFELEYDGAETLNRLKPLLDGDCEFLMDGDGPQSPYHLWRVAYYLRTSKSWTPLYKPRKLSVAKLLVRHGAEILIENVEGSPVGYFKWRRLHEISDFLAEYQKPRSIRKLKTSTSTEVPL